VTSNLLVAELSVQCTLQKRRDSNGCPLLCMFLVDSLSDDWFSQDCSAPWIKVTFGAKVLTYMAWHSTSSEGCQCLRHWICKCYCCSNELVMMHSSINIFVNNTIILYHLHSKNLTTSSVTRVPTHLTWVPRFSVGPRGSSAILKLAASDSQIYCLSSLCLVVTTTRSATAQNMSAYWSHAHKHRNVVIS